jgi:Cys-rich four helix bundle protein (predicted Tat secretion target)
MTKAENLCLREAQATRRSVLALAAGAGSAAVLAVAGGAAIAEDAPKKRRKPAAKPEEHHHHDMAAMGEDVPPSNVALVAAALHCVKMGEACFNHCVQTLSRGDTSMKECIRTTSSMLPMCTVLARFSAMDAKRLKELAKLCIDVCGDCRAECEKHKDHHATCKACMESCAACIDECKKLIAA